MQFPESWLREFCNPPLSTQQLADRLTMAGLEVEALSPVAPAFTGVVVGEIVGCEQHPNADRLRVCQVDVGESKPLQIVCGAPNARVGIRVPCATVGAVLPPSGPDAVPFHIKLSQLRGVESQGMLCSANELQIAADTAGLMELETTAPIGRCIRETLKLDDTLFTLKLTPNLAHCLSVYGVARELSALTGTPLVSPAFTPVLAAHDDVVVVRVESTDLCGRFSGRVVQGVNPKASTPRWMVDRLARCGQRSVSALVDISNYVMFELGRPSHIFDRDRIAGALQVRWGKTGESLKLLNGNEVALDEQVGVIADDARVESLAGIMGGDHTAVSDDTRNIYIEAAFWWPRAVAGRSRRFNFSTDAGHRFERGVDPEGTVEHIERITALVLDICGGKPGMISDDRCNMPLRSDVAMRVSRASRVLGLPLTQAQCVHALSSLGLRVRTEGLDGLVSEVPSFRFDLQIEEDLIEEVIRVVGLDALPQTPPLAPIVPRLQSESQRTAHSVRRQMAGLGYLETINYSFVDEAWERDLCANATPITVLNPIASHMSVMRSSLLGSLLQVLRYNVDRKIACLRVFELGRVFLRNPASQDTDTTVAGFDQPMRVGGLAYGPVSGPHWEGKAKLVDFFDIKADIDALLAPRRASYVAAVHPALHPGRTARVWVDGVAIGWLGELHPQWRQQSSLTQPPILFELDLAAVINKSVPSAQSVSRLQPVERDLAVVVAESVSHDALVSAVWAAPTAGQLKDVVVFDIYRPTSAMVSGSALGATGMQVGEKSLALRLTLLDEHRTLTDSDIDAHMQAVLSTLSKRVGARLRS
jgi:phenylalanyl-tRNA synthetase beta chain